MGWQVDVHWVAMPIARCGEIGCNWEGTLGLTEIRARKEADDHWRWHAAEWERRNEEWEHNEATQDR